MEGLTPHSGYLKNLWRQARGLTSASLSLTNLFAEEAIHLNRKDEASRLKALHSFIKQQLDREKSREDAASYGHSQANLIFSLGGLAASGIIEMVSKNKRQSATAGHLLQSLNNEQRPFGRVLVCIGPKGMPDDVQVVSISQSARESNRPESEVTNEFQERGCLLFSEKELSLLIDRLVDDVREGRLCLPISREKLSKITASSKAKLRAKKVE